MLNTLLLAMMQAQAAPSDLTGAQDGLEKIKNFIEQTGYFKYYLLVMFLLWLIARLGQKPRKDFSAEAQRVLDEKYQKGEIDTKTYEKYRQELSMRLKKE